RSRSMLTRFPIFRSDSIFFKQFSVFPISFFELVRLPREEAGSYRFKSVPESGVYAALSSSFDLAVIDSMVSD
ncbi:MAG: DUF2887 domain-containing protein, partial [Cyanobacteria bacterium P01_E01_bin.34]